MSNFPRDNTIDDPRHQPVRRPVQAPGAAQRRPAPKRSGTSLLDDILGKTAKLHSSVRNTRVGDDANDVATPYMMSKSASASSSLLVCRMPECTPPNTAAIFDIDMRHGDRVCVRCGTVQNSRSIESQEEEHRTFADDDKAESKKRTEINDGKQGGPPPGPGPGPSPSPNPSPDPDPESTPDPDSSPSLRPSPSPRPCSKPNPGPSQHPSPRPSPSPWPNPHQAAAPETPR